MQINEELTDCFEIGRAKLILYPFSKPYKYGIISVNNKEQHETVQNRILRKYLKSFRKVNNAIQQRTMDRNN